MGKHGRGGELPLTFGKLLYSTTTYLGQTRQQDLLATHTVPLITTRARRMERVA